MGVIPPRLRDGTISHLGVREFISKYEAYKEQMPKVGDLSEGAYQGGTSCSTVTKGCRKCL